MGRGRIFAVVVLLLVAGLPVAAVDTTAQEQDRVTLTVSVVDQQGDAVGGITVVASWEGDSARDETAANGGAFLDVPEGDAVEIRVVDETYMRNFPFSISSATERDVSLVVAPQGTAELAVTDRSGRVSDVAVSLTDDQGRVVSSGETDESGVFTTGAVQPGQYDLTLEKAGYLNNETRFEVVAGQQNATLELRAETVAVSFIVEDDHFEEPEPLAGATVRVQDVGRQNTSNDGRVTFSLSVNTDHPVELSKEGYRSVSRNVEVAESDRTITLQTRRTRALLVAPVTRQVVIGEATTVDVTNAYGEPISGATVFKNGVAQGTTGEDGTVRVTIEQAGNQSLTAETDELSSESVSVVGVSVDGETTAVTATPAAGDSTSTPAVSLPGFGPAIGIVAILLATLWLRRRG